MEKRDKRFVGVLIGGLILSLIIGVFSASFASAITPKCENKYEYLLNTQDQSWYRNNVAGCKSFGNNWGLVNLSNENELIDVLSYLSYSNAPHHYSASTHYWTNHSSTETPSGSWFRNYAVSADDLNNDQIAIVAGGNDIEQGNWRLGDGPASQKHYGFCENPTATCESARVFNSGSTLNNGLVAYWPLDYAFGRATATTPKTPDVIGNNHGTLVGGTNFVTGKINQAANFDGVDDYINSPNIGNYNQTTISFWVYPKNSHPTRGGLLSQGYYISASDGYLGHVFSIYNGNLAYFIDRLGTGWLQNESAVTLPINTWSYVTIILEESSSSGKIIIYKNGIEMHRFVGNMIIDPDYSTGFSLGKVRYHGDRWFNGSIDEVGVWNRALNANEVQQLYNYYVNPPPPYNISNASWKNINGISITSAQEGDSVLMIVGGENLAGTQVDYTIQKLGAPTVWNLWNLFGLKPWTSLPSVSGMGAQPYVVNSSGSYKFIAKVEGSSVEKESEVLSVSSFDNARPRAIITSPENGFRTSINKVISFTQRSYDEDDLLIMNWSFMDGSADYIKENYSLALTPNIADTTHSFANAGIYDVKLTASEMPGRAIGQSSVNKTRVYVFEEGLNVVPVITTPEQGIAYGKGWVLFNASQSYVANCSYSARTPLDFVAGNLNCSYIHAPGRINVGTGYDLKLNWTVFTGTSLDFSIEKDWSTNYNGSVVFDHRFSKSGEHRARLKLKYVAK